MRISGTVFVFLMLYAAPVIAAEKLKLPPEITPKLRAACESDVRRLCIGKKPTIAKVKRCVAKKFFKLGRRCQMELAAVGITGL
ncbi:MAG: hypothetical protein V3U85_07620 [Hyphomicrobium sp.]|jgi:hypothetical protein